MATYPAAVALSVQHKNVLAVLKYKDLIHTSCSVYDCTQFFSSDFLFKHTIKTHGSGFDRSLLGVHFKIIRSVWKSCHYLTAFKAFLDRSMRRRKGEPGRYSITTTPCTQTQYLPSHIQLRIRFIISALTSVCNVYSSSKKSFHLILSLQKAVCIWLPTKLLLSTLETLPQLLTNSAQFAPTFYSCTLSALVPTQHVPNLCLPPKEIFKVLPTNNTLVLLDSKSYTGL